MLVVLTPLNFFSFWLNNKSSFPPLSYICRQLVLVVEVVFVPVRCSKSSKPLIADIED